MQNMKITYLLIMRRIFRRPKPIWPKPEESIGSECLDWQIKGVRCFEMIGPVCAIYETVLLPAIDKVLTKNKEELEQGEAKHLSVGYGMHMVGSVPATAFPTIIIASLSKQQRKMIKALIKNEGILSKYSGIQIKTLEQEPAVLTALMEMDQHSVDVVVRTHLGPQIDETIQTKSKQSLTYGSRIRAGKYWMTLGGIIYVTVREVTGQYGLTAGHGTLNYEGEDDEGAHNLDREMEFDSDSDDFYLDESKKEWTSKGDVYCSSSCKPITYKQKASVSSRNGTSNNKSSPLLSDPLSGSSGQQQEDNLQINIEPEDRLNLDYVLFPMDPETVHPPSQGSVFYNNNTLSVSNFVKENKGGSVLALVTAGQQVEGEIQSCPYMLKMPGWDGFQEVWTVRLKSTLSPGHSGSWVIDATTGDLFGVIVAARLGSKTAFVLPAWKVFRDIEERTGGTVSLAVPVEAPKNIPSNVHLGLPTVNYQSLLANSTSYPSLHSKEQYELGKKKDKITKQLRELEERQIELGKQRGEIIKQRIELEGRQIELEKKQDKIAKQRVKLDDQQIELGKLRSKLTTIIHDVEQRGESSLAKSAGTLLTNITTTEQFANSSGDLVQSSKRPVPLAYVKDVDEHEHPSSTQGKSTVLPDRLAYSGGQDHKENTKLVIKQRSNKNSSRSPLQIVDVDENVTKSLISTRTDGVLVPPVPTNSYTEAKEQNIQRPNFDTDTSSLLLQQERRSKLHRRLARPPSGRDGDTVSRPQDRPGFSGLAYQRPKPERLFCQQCQNNPEGFRGEHELQRHQDRVHKKSVKKFICVEPTHEDRIRVIIPLSACKACNQKREYGAYYNAAAHLRRAHFKPKISKGKSKHVKEVEEKRGREGGGNWPPMTELRHWMKEIEVVAPDQSFSQQEEDNLLDDSLEEARIVEAGTATPRSEGGKEAKDNGHEGGEFDIAISRASSSGVGSMVVSREEKIGENEGRAHRRLRRPSPPPWTLQDQGYNQIIISNTGYELILAPTNATKTS